MIAVIDATKPVTDIDQVVISPEPGEVVAVRYSDKTVYYMTQKHRSCEWCAFNSPRVCTCLELPLSCHNGAFKCVELEDLI